MTKLRHSATVFALLTSIAGSVVANEIELNLSNDFIDVRLRSDFEQDFAGRAAYLYADSKGDDVQMLSYTLMASGQIEGVDIVMGIRPYVLDIGRDNSIGLAVGGGVSYEWIEKLSTSAELYYSPEIITGGDFDDTLDLELRASYQIIDNASVSVGYRWIEIGTDFGDVDHDDLFLGVTLSF